MNRTWSSLKESGGIPLISRYNSYASVITYTLLHHYHTSSSHLPSLLTPREEISIPKAIRVQRSQLNYTANTVISNNTYIILPPQTATTVL